MNRHIKLTISIVVLLVSAHNIHSQSIAIDTSSNWQQWISGILGGNCVEISNVQFSNHPGSAARFTNADDIGLTQGIVLSTGEIGPQADTSADFFLNGIFNDSEGDSLLEVYAIQEIGYTGNVSSYDATRLEFDFVAPSDQTVNIRFVFASEEYPEFAPPINSYFNDIFAFFVSAEGSGTYENIANVPGTNLPVTIGNINAITNTEYYIENTGDHFAFDAFTTPISATFQAIGGTTYHMIIAISDIGDFNFDSAVFLELNSNGSQSIHGTSYAGMDPLSAAQVELFGFNTDPGAFDAVSTTSTDNSGDYTFENVEEGLYLIHVTPDNTVFPDALPIYYPGVVLWEEATAVGISCDSIGIDGPGMIFNTGPGMITGIIGQDPFGGRLRSEDLIPYEGVNVFLQDSASLEWRGFDISDVNGEYNFQNLAAGTYYVIPDVAGIPVIEPRKVVITESSPSAENINFQMNEDGVVNVEAGIIQVLESGSAVSWQVTYSPYYWLGNNQIIKTGGDTLINDTTYTLLLVDGIQTDFDPFNENEAVVLGCFRQEGTRLYMRYLYEFSELTDYSDVLYFDMAYQIGDTIRNPYIDGVFGIITNIDTIDLGGNIRYRWELERNGSDQHEWFVSGTGNSKGLFNLLSEEVINGSVQLNTCFTDFNNQSFFSQEMYTPESFGILDICFVILESIENISTNPVSVFPNPGSGSFTVQRENGGLAQLKVLDVSGRLLFSQQISASQEIISADRLDAGIYLIEITENDGGRSITRWICQ